MWDLSGGLTSHQGTKTNLTGFPTGFERETGQRKDGVCQKGSRDVLMGTQETKAPPTNFARFLVLLKAVLLQVCLPGRRDGNSIKEMGDLCGHAGPWQCLMMKIIITDSHAGLTLLLCTVQNLMYIITHLILITVL